MQNGGLIHNFVSGLENKNDAVQNRACLSNGIPTSWVVFQTGETHITVRFLYYRLSTSIHSGSSTENSLVVGLRWFDPEPDNWDIGDIVVIIISSDEEHAVDVCCGPEREGIAKCRRVAEFEVGC